MNDAVNLADVARLTEHLRRERDEALQRAREAEKRVVDLEFEVIRLRERISVLRGVSV